MGKHRTGLYKQGYVFESFVNMSGNFVEDGSLVCEKSGGTMF